MKLKWSSGFTLIELIITVMLVSIMIGLTANSIVSAVAQARVGRAFTDVYDLLVRARGVAMREKGSVSIDIVGNQVKWSRDGVVVDTVTYSSVNITSNLGPTVTLSVNGFGLIEGAAVAVTPLTITVQHSSGTFASRLELNRNGYILKL